MSRRSPRMFFGLSPSVKKQKRAEISKEKNRSRIYLMQEIESWEIEKKRWVDSIEKLPTLLKHPTWAVGNPAFSKHLLEIHRMHCQQCDLDAPGESNQSFGLVTTPCVVTLETIPDPIATSSESTSKEPTALEPGSDSELFSTSAQSLSSQEAKTPESGSGSEVISTSALSIRHAKTPSPTHAESLEDENEVNTTTASSSDIEVKVVSASSSVVPVTMGPKCNKICIGSAMHMWNEERIKRAMTHERFAQLLLGLLDVNKQKSSKPSTCDEAVKQAPLGRPRVSDLLQHPLGSTTSLYESTKTYLDKNHRLKTSVPVAGRLGVASKPINLHVVASAAPGLPATNKRLKTSVSATGLGVASQHRPVITIPTPSRPTIKLVSVPRTEVCSTNFLSIVHQKPLNFVTKSIDRAPVSLPIFRFETILPKPQSTPERTIQGQNCNASIDAYMTRSIQKDRLQVSTCESAVVKNDVLTQKTDPKRNVLMPEVDLAWLLKCVLLDYDSGVT